MKKMNCLTLLMVLVLALLMTGLAGAATDTAIDTFSITVQEIAVLDVAGILGNFSVSTPAAGGATFVVTNPDSNSYLQYTSTVASGRTRTISAEVTTGDIPAGLKLNVTSATPTGIGTVGSAVSGGRDYTPGSLTGGTLITGIGSCYTGTGASDGARLTYTVSIVTVANLIVETQNITITFTINDDV